MRWKRNQTSSCSIAPLNTRDLLIPYPGKAFAVFGDEAVD